jgi:pentatricopeptide repeat protein
MAIYAISSEIHHRQSDSEIKLQMATKADSILKRMEQRYETTKRGEVQPTTISYSTVLKAWANAGIAVEAEKVLNKMIAVAENSTSGKARPNLICFNTVIGGWAKTKGRESAERAMNILEKMEKLSETRDYPDIFPDTITYSSVISAYARSGREDAGDHAEELLQRSLRLFHGGRKDLKPDTMTFCSVLDALSKQNRINKQNRKISSPDESEDARAEAVFERMKEMYKDGDTSVRPNVVAYNILLGVYADCMKSEKANALFEEMCQMYEAGDFHMKPDIISYNHYLFALANSFSRQNVDKAIDLLNKMENKINDTTKPNLSSYLAILKALAKQSKRYPDAAEKCEIIVKNMEDRYLRGESSVKPDIACYNCWIDVYSKSGSKDAASNALNIIERVITLSKDLDLRPDVVSFTTAMNAIANSNCAPDSAEALLDQMTELNIKPNKYTYNSFVSDD